ncbi:MAG: alpha-D-glucose phosphate-specific phosphoglucomutase [Alphaproteobacteria bacterium]|nr:alpha-D-glucose phosphate-specific phosphoglucomutase [Alphaproteobacteria bacterium]MBQ8557599.1 alpha-D-glucose phosphate-specific phosphoglucomutase [Alphaproteobacteria bacterium]MBR3913136.1 alpha-D-glucose phosphate-specific phosphoglucomutase [Alphaproteobacteria bacterium]
MEICTIKTQPYTDQVCGTSGLRKKVSVFKQPNYLENFVQSIFNSLTGFEGQTLVIGGDGRYFNAQAIQSIIKIAIANQFGRLIIGQNGILSTPAASHLIVKRKAFGGIILSASHNPGGPNGDFGIKYDTAQGAPAPQNLTDIISEKSKTIDHYWSCNMPDIDLSKIGEQSFGTTIIEIVDSIDDYAQYMETIFDFDAIRSLFQNGFTMIYDAMNAVTGPYAKRIFEEMLGAPKNCVQNANPLPDFGGLHPEPNLTYAKELVDKMYAPDAPDFGAASDGDGDRYMILGNRFFVSPADSLAILTEYADKIPFYQGKMYGVARSMPTANAVDYVLKAKNLPVYATPTGWKFFSSLLETQKITLCGEESFGSGSFHLCEKDGIWAILFWLNIIALTGKSVQTLTEELWKKYGRVYNSTQSYEGLDSEQAKQMLDALEQNLSSFVGKEINGFKITETGIFEYTDPVTGEQAHRQGYCVLFDNARIFMRLSGTGSSGATLRVYYMKRETNPTELTHNALTYIEPLVETFKQLSNIYTFTGRTEPSVRT